MNINNWPKPNETVYNQNLENAIKRNVNMQMLSMLGLSSEDITKLETTMKAVAAMPEKIDGLTKRIESLEKEVVKNGGTNTGTNTGTIKPIDDGGSSSELEFNAEHGLATDENGNITKF